MADEKIISIIVKVIIIWGGAIVSIAFHEIGHLAGYKICTKSAKWNIVIGTGKRFISVKKMQIHLIPLLGFFCISDDSFPKRKRDDILTTIGGPVFSLVLLFILQLLVMTFRGNNSGLFINTYEETATFLRNYNIYLILFSVIPMKYPPFLVRGKIDTSDGLQLLNALLKKGTFSGEG